ncbi:MAG: hypothetical protein OHK0046_04410 [Anaerolineae bacterium]
MAKRSQTTGRPKIKTTQPVHVETSEADKSVQNRVRSTVGLRPLSDFKSHAEREAEIQRRVILGTIAAVVFVVILIAAALIYDRVYIPSRPVAEVNGDTISVRAFQQRVRFERLIGSERLSAGINSVIDETGLTFEDAANAVVSREPYATIWQELNAPDILGLRVLDEMINDELVRQEADELGVTVSQEDIDREIEQLFNFDSEAVALLGAEVTPEVTDEAPTSTPTPLVSPTPSPTATITPTFEVEPTATITPFPTVPPPATRTPDERLDYYNDSLSDFYRLASNEAGYSRQQVNNYFEVQALRAALAEQVVEPETTSTWVNARHILVETEEEAQDIIASLNAGESFASLARAVSTDTGSGAQGGELGWGPVEQYVEEFAEAVRTAEVGAIVGPVQSQFGYHVIQVRGREERPIEDEVLIEQSTDEAFGEWLSELRSSEETNAEIYDNWPDFVPPVPLQVWNYREP